MEIKETLDTKVLRILFDYYTGHRGDPQMLITDLYAELPDEDQGVIHAEILKLQEKAWVSCDLTADGLSGFVGIEAKGIKIMSARTKPPPPAPAPKLAVKAAPSAETPIVSLPGMRYDIFVSYSGDADQQSIIRALTKIKQLVGVLCSDFVPRGPRWVEHAEWTPQARADAQASATFLIVLSQQYLASAWCQGDASFLQTLRQHLKYGKFFLLAIEQTEHPEVLQGEIIHAIAGAAASTPDLQRDQNQLWQLSQNLTNELQRLLKRAEIGRKLLNKGVLLDHDPVDQQLADNVARRLNRFGVGYVLPSLSIASGSTPSEAKNEFEEQVLGSDGLLMVYGAAPKEWLIREVNRMRRIFAKHQPQPQPNAYAIYNGPPPTDKLPEPFIFPGLLIDCRACQSNEQDCEQCSGKQAFVQFVERLQEETHA